MSDHITLFRFRLAKGQSISPKVLRTMWSDACRSNDVSVGRSNAGSGFGEDMHTYLLLGSPKMQNLADIEVRMQKSLAQLSPSATIRLTTV